MKIIVCVKQVADIYVQRGYDPDIDSIVSEGLVYILNPHDEVATEEAIRQKEVAGGGEVTAITIGPSRAEEVLRWCLAMGVDNAIHVLNDRSENLDPWVTASLLADLIEDMEYDLLLFGKIAIDDEMGQVGTFVAELLDLPVVTGVTKIDIDEGKAAVQRALDKGNREEVTCPIPGVFTIDKKLSRPRYPTLPIRMVAETKPIQRIEMESLSSLTPSKMDRVRLGPPKLRPKRIVMPDSNLSPADRLKFVMTGGLGKKKGGSVGGDPKQSASSIVDFLKEKNVIGS
ncbi:MAG: electron transfer flavoprotein subunit beta/FixA family protein [Desulfobacterales bacterium]